VSATIRDRALLLATVALVAACKTADPQLDSSPGVLTCRVRFAACAPPVYYDESTEAERLGLRKQVEASLRMDLPEKVSRDSAALVLSHVRDSDVPTLLALSVLYEDAWAVLGKCQCPGEKNEWDRKRIGETLARRLPPAELRSPKNWQDRMVARLATIRDLTHQIALRGLAGQPAEDLETARRKADLELCEAVHGARANLLQADYLDTVEAVLRRRDADAGRASADFAAAAIRGYEQNASCALAATPPARPAAPAAAPAAAPGAAPPVEPADEDEDR
jgi:hypothetical protein